MEDKRKKILEVSELMKVISNSIRLEILCYLEKGEMSVNEIKEKIQGISQPAISQHLNLLKMNKILTTEKRGQHVYYRISDLRVISLMNSIRQIFCS